MSERSERAGQFYAFFKSFDRYFSDFWNIGGVFDNGEQKNGQST